VRTTHQRLRIRSKYFGAPAGLPIAFCAFIIGFSFAEPGIFFTAADFKAVVITESTILLLSIAVLFPLRAGDFDLSVSALMVLSGAILLRLLGAGVPLAIAIILTLMSGVVVGLFNAIAVVKFGIDSFIATLGTLSLLTGLGYFLTNSQTLINTSTGLSNFANYNIGPFPLSVYYSWVFVIIAWYVFQKTPYGTYLIVVGRDRSAAARLGIPVQRIRMSAYVVASLMAAFAGVALTGFLGSVDATTSAAYLLPPYAAAYLGSTTIVVGEFNSFGTLIALYFIAVGTIGFELMGVSQWVGDVFSGAALLAGVLSSQLLARASQRRLAAS